MNRWIWIVVGALGFMLAANGVMVWVAVKNPPQVLPSGDEWKASK